MHQSLSMVKTSGLLLLLLSVSMDPDHLNSPFIELKWWKIADPHKERKELNLKFKCLWYILISKGPQ